MSRAGVRKTLRANEDAARMWRLEYNGLQERYTDLEREYALLRHQIPVSSHCAEPSDRTPSLYAHCQLDCYLYWYYYPTH